VFLAAAALYVLTSQRGAVWQDSGLRAWQVVHGDLHGQLGLALAHPGYILLAQPCRLLGRAHVLTALNAFSGIGMAVALANLAAVVALLTDRRWIGAATGAMLAVAHTPWWLATIAEAYTWSVAGLTAELWLLVVLVRRPHWRTLAGLALLNGLGLCVHNMALLPLPVYVVVAIVLIAQRRLPVWSLAGAAGAWIVGAGLYIGMTVQEAVRFHSLSAGLQSALFGRFAGAVLNVGHAPPRLTQNAALAAMNAVSFVPILAVVGWIALRRRAGGMLAAALAAITILHAAFVTRYAVADQFTFLLPTLTMIALAAGLGVASLATISRRWRVAAATACIVSVLAPPAFYVAAPHLARTVGGRTGEGRLPGRDELRYFLVPWKHNEDSAERFARRALAQAAPNGIILAGGTSKYPLLLVQWRDATAPDVAIQHNGQPLPTYRPETADAFARALGGRALFAVAPDRSVLSADLLEAVRIKQPDEHEVLARLTLEP